MGGTINITDSTEVVAVEDCLSTTLDGESVILHTGVGKYYGFNQVGTEVWESLQEPAKVEELTEDLVAEYDVGYDRCREDVEELLTELADKDLVEVVDN